MPGVVLRIFPLVLLLTAHLLAGEPRLEPPWQRLNLAPDAAAEVAFVLRAPPESVASACLIDCACLRCETRLPATVDASGTLVLHFRATGLRPGVEPITVVTTAGSARAELQIAGPGTGDGISVLRATLAQAQAQRLGIWGVVHHLRGQTRNCGCSAGALGGIGHLAALPGQSAALAPGVAMRWVLTGDPDGQRPGVAAVLAESGWRRGDPAIAEAADIAPLLMQPGIVAVIPAGPVAINHRRILQPILDRGLTVDLLLVDAQGLVMEHRVLPVDATLDDAPPVTARFPDPLSTRIDPAAKPSAACLACHASAHAAWAPSGHALALERLPAPDRTETCVVCHTTPVASPSGSALAGGVHCQACHLGGSAHAADPLLVRTTGTSDCRTCHDAQHDPGFQREAAWMRIQHQRDAPHP